MGIVDASKLQFNTSLQSLFSLGNTEDTEETENTKEKTEKYIEFRTNLYKDFPNIQNTQFLTEQKNIFLQLLFPLDKMAQEFLQNIASDNNSNNNDFVKAKDALIICGKKIKT
ncbi:MAG: hypothetical protein QS2022_0560 [Candidatus Phytoplasma asteris]|nr:MAG: hypothetical protein PLY_0560 [Periwinkle leaf yellowing phytoplasma]WEX19346.1 MAG: hypothetical protein QS2022_0560 [Candidatus Phytoplasma asteris]